MYFFYIFTKTCYYRCHLRQFLDLYTFHSDLAYISLLKRWLPYDVILNKKLLFKIYLK